MDLNELAVELYGMTKAEAQSKGMCLQCKEPAIPKCYSEEGKREYRISGLCEVCFDQNCGVAESESGGRY